MKIPGLRGGLFRSKELNRTAEQLAESCANLEQKLEAWTRTLARKLEAMDRGGSLDGAGKRLEPLAARYEAAASELREIRRGLPA
jgi:hypothetical protein